MHPDTEGKHMRSSNANYPWSEFALSHCTYKGGSAEGLCEAGPREVTYPDMLV